MGVNSSSIMDDLGATEALTETQTQASLTNDPKIPEDAPKHDGPQEALLEVSSTAFLTRPSTVMKTSPKQTLQATLKGSKKAKKRQIETNETNETAVTKTDIPNKKPRRFQFALRRLAPEIRDAIFEYAFHNTKTEKHKQNALLKALKPHPHRTHNGDKILFTQAMEVFNKTHHFKVSALSSGQIRDFDEQTLNAIRYLTIQITRNKNDDSFSDQFALAKNVRHLTFTANHKDSNRSYSLSRAIGAILPSFQQLRTIDVKYTIKPIQTSPRKEEDARKNAKLFVPLINLMTGIHGEWTQESDEVDHWAWKVEKGKTFKITRVIGALVSKRSTTNT